MTSAVSLLDLPNELVLIVSASLDDDTLLHLAATCRRLNFLLIPAVLARYNIAPPNLSLDSLLPALSFNSKTLVVLPVLAMASSVTSIEDLDVVFRTYSSYAFMDNEEIFDAVRTLNSLAIRLKYLGHLRFNPYITGHSARGHSGRSAAVCAVLNTVVERGDCAVTVYSGPEDTYGADPRPFAHVFLGTAQANANARSETHTPSETQTPSARKTTIAQRLRRTLASFSCLHRQRVVPAPLPSSHSSTSIHTVVEIQSTLCPPPIALPVSLKPRLTTLSIHAPLLLHATFFPWTLHTLNSSPLTSLSLQNIDLFHYDWALILPLLTLANLEELHLGAQCAIAVPDLEDFLVRHSSVMVLDLRHFSALGALVPGISTKAAAAVARASYKTNMNKETTPTPETFLPRLTSFTAPSEYLLYFLAPPDFGFFSSPAPSSSSSSPSMLLPTSISSVHEESKWYPSLRLITASTPLSSPSADQDNVLAPYHTSRLELVHACVARRGLRLEVLYRDSA
ncbi:F-box domain-containing protein [Mycena sanguinolenta]|uniref:F-box domain-containing protein n=1 Tax=Mycena sanguinolenta TaxID=230812 RepID=A0A8H6TZP7_9AGAR|nr:F-box domain-containing protein [Mycena sanguinolenta]